MAVQDLKFVRWMVALAKNSPWVVIAIGLHVIVGAVMSVVYIHHELTKSNVSDTQINVGATRKEAPPVVQPPEQIDRKKIPENQQAELVSYDEEQTFVPTEIVEQDLHLEIGDPTGADDGSTAESGGTSIGVGAGGHYGTGKPSTLLSRRPGTGEVRQKGRQPDGPTVATEKAVLEGLCWLIRHQNADGSWGVDTLVQHCNPDTPCIPPDAELDATYNEGLTGLALLAFLGQGLSLNAKLEIVDTAMGKKHNAGKVVQAGIRSLLERQNEDGSFSDAEPFLYPENETLSAMALSEAYGLSRNRELRRPAQRALDFIVAAQKRDADGRLTGWGSGSGADLEARLARGEIEQAAYEEGMNAVDLAITCWVVMALESARTCGFSVPPETLRAALDYTVEATSGGRQSLFRTGDGSTDPVGHLGKESALGMLLRAFLERDVQDPYLELGAERIVAGLPGLDDPATIDFYYWYFATLALNQFDGPDCPRKGAGKYWKPWNEALVPALLELQDDDRRRDVCSRGGWLADTRGNVRGRALYNTAMNVLTLEVYYRFDNVFGAATRAAVESAPAPDKTK